MASQLSKKELALFKLLRIDKQEDSKTFSKSSNRGLWKTIIEQYPESAHFIYELLQNANDAKATYVEIVISNEGLIFKHNGAVQFSVTPLDAKPVGHINSITSIGDSSKDGMNTIGKFGIGFKSVFTYTNLPEIYDDKFWFRIDNYIVPSLLAKDHPMRKKGETLFWLPFKPGEEDRCYKEVTKKIQTLDSPILFLDSLRSVLWVDSISGQSSQYKKDIEEVHNIGDIMCELTSIQNSQEKCKLWMFHREIKFEGSNRLHRISVGYYLKEGQDKDVIDTNVNPKVFCFFPTSEKFEQKRVMHAPFLLTASRSEILKDNNHNEHLIAELAKLSADSLVCLRDIGICTKVSLLNENLLDLVHIPDYYDFYPEFTKEYIRVIKNNNLIITKGGKYTSTANARIAQPIRLQKIFSDKQLAGILGNGIDIHFAFPTITSYEYRTKDYLLNKLGVQICDTKKIAQSITSQFMSEQDDAWLHKFYKFIKEEAIDYWNSSSKEAFLRYAPIIRTNKRKFIAPYDKDALNVFYSTPGYTLKELAYVDQKLLSNENTKKFFDELGIREYDKKDTITQILVRYDKGGEIDDDVLRNDLCFIYGYCSNDASQKERCKLIDILRQRLNVVYTQNGSSFYGPISRVYDIKENKEYFDGNDDIWVIDYDFYKEIFDRYGESNILAFLHELGLNTKPRIVENSKVTPWELNQRQRNQILDSGKRPTYGYKITDCQMDGLVYALENHLSYNVSKLIWNWLCEGNPNSWVLACVYMYTNHNETRYGETSLYITLTETAWLYNEDGTVLKPNEISWTQLKNAGYKYNESLLEFLGISANSADDRIDGLTEEQQEIYDLGLMLQDSGVSKKRLKELIANEKKQQRQRVAESTTTEDDLFANEPLRKADAEEMFSNNNDKKFAKKQQCTPIKTNATPVSIEERMKKFLDSQKDA